MLRHFHINLEETHRLVTLFWHHAPFLCGVRKITIQVCIRAYGDKHLVRYARIKRHRKRQRLQPRRIDIQLDG